MSGSDVAVIVKEIVLYCAPAAFIINLVGWGMNAIIGAATGKGIRL